MKKNLRMAVTAALTLGVVSLGGVQAFAADEDRTADEHMLGEDRCHGDANTQQGTEGECQYHGDYRKGY